MNPIKFTAFLLYRYYSGGRRPDNIPYFRTMCSMTLLVLMHVFQILILLRKTEFIPINPSDSKDTKWLIMLLIMLPIYFLLTLLVKKNELQKMKEEYSYSWDKIFKWNVWFIIYIVLSFSLIFVLAALVK